jgi:hypothetical protein
VPYTPEAKARFFTVYAWFRQRLVLLIVAAMLILQFMTWREIDRLYIPSPPDCSYLSPCHVRGTVGLDEDTIRRISK